MSNRIAIVTGGANSIGSEVRRALSSGGAQVVLADSDLSRDESVAEQFARVELQLGAVATLVCITDVPREPGIGTRIATTTLDSWVEAEARNARAAFLWVREFLRRRTALGVDEGRIVTVVSSAALQPCAATAAAVATSQAGVLALTRIAALEAGPVGITVNAIVVDRNATPAGAVAETVCFLSSAGARHITGAAIAVNGGSHLNL
jgi:3-oxoacyl-[acyl-carrier protein] reductase